LLWRAEALRLSGRPAAEVRAAFDAAAATVFPPDRRFLALVRRAEFERLTATADAVSSIARAIAESDEFSRLSLRDAEGVVWSARKWAADVLGQPENHSDAETAAAHPRVDRVPLPRFPLRPTWRVSLDFPRERALLPINATEPGFVFVAGRHWLACRDVRDTGDRWRRALAFAPLWLTALDGSVIVAGDAGAARLAADDGRLEWEFRLPETAPWFDRPGWRDLGANAPAGRLSGFQWTGTRLVARLGSRSLLAIDGVTGEPCWQRQAPFGATFHPAYFADRRCVVDQSTDGRRSVYGTHDGRLLSTGPAPLRPWPNPPTALDSGRLLVVEDGRLVVLDRTTWKPAWTWDLPRWSSLTGDPAQTRLIDGNVYVGIDRNDCFEIERLETEDGRPIGEPIAVGREQIDLRATACDYGVLHVINEGELRSIDTRKNRTVSAFRVPAAARWRIESTSDGHDGRRGGDAARLPARWRIESTTDGLLLWTEPAVLPPEVPRRGRVLALPSNHERRDVEPWMELRLGPGTVRSVQIVGDEVVVVTDDEVRAFRGVEREAK
jgi:outer membrane protein assembly factor BamB